MSAFRWTGRLKPDTTDTHASAVNPLVRQETNSRSPQLAKSIACGCHHETAEALRRGASGQCLCDSAFPGHGWAIAYS
jgi:hypothetical protein